MQGCALRLDELHKPSIGRDTTGCLGVTFQLAETPTGLKFTLQLMHTCNTGMHRGVGDGRRADRPAPWCMVLAYRLCTLGNWDYCLSKLTDILGGMSEDAHASEGRRRRRRTCHFGTRCISRRVALPPPPVPHLLPIEMRVNPHSQLVPASCLHASTHSWIDSNPSLWDMKTLG